MIKLFSIGIGGFCGAILRYSVGGIVHRLFHQTAFPYGTLVVNLIGCFFIGFGAGLIESRQMFTPEMRAFIFIGIIGSFTTFSTFGLETFNLARSGQGLASLTNLCISVFAGLLAISLGNSLSKIV